MRPGALGTHFNDRTSPFERFDAATDRIVGHGEVPLALRYFGGAGLSYMAKYGTTLEDFARIRAKASRHAMNNPLALFRQELTVEDVMNSPAVWPGARFRQLRQEKRAERCRPHRGAGDAHRPAVDLRGRRHDAGGRLRHDRRRGDGRL
jgi:hypothetical protein